ncbi:nuclease-related domain-containing protein [Nocardia shimofusensis]|uniref:nuclease-related domain-containing protein n=1 Tax=Nocardia shimofusensis TaxID=228596 RepID=UPI000835D3FA|nr:nuclease-related domain-containing protein [Nocardia shimofusensis]
MLVIDEATAHTAGAYPEQRVLDWMRAWSGQFIIVGLAISGCRLGEREHTDLVVLTPRATIVMEVKGTAPEAREGVLSMRSDGRWKLSGYDGDPLDHPETDDAETDVGERPFDRVSDSISALSEAARRHHSDARVEGLVVIVPPGESDITVRAGAGRPRCGVVVAESAADLRAWFHRTANRAIVWSAEAAHELLTDLGAGERVSVEDLLAEGFPSRARLDYLASPEYAAAVTAARRHTEQRKQAAAEPEGTDGVRVGDLRAGEEMVPAAFTVGTPGAHLVVEGRAVGDAEALPAEVGIAGRDEPAPAPAPPLVSALPVAATAVSSSASARPRPATVIEERLPEPDSDSAFTDDWSSWIGPQRLRFRRTEVLRPAWLDDPDPAESGLGPSAAAPVPPARPSAGRDVRTGRRLGEGLGEAARRAVDTGSARVRETAQRVLSSAPSRPRPEIARPAQISAQLRGSAEINPHRRQQVVALTLIAALLSTFWILASACSAPHRSADDTRGLGSTSVAERNALACSLDTGPRCALRPGESGLLTNY